MYTQFCPSQSDSLFQRVPGHIGTVQMNVTGSHSYVEFQVSATIIVDGEEDEGERSPITSDSTVFVPSPSKLIKGISLMHFVYY